MMPAGQVAVRKKVGGGSFVCGLKRILTPEDTLECHAAIGKTDSLRFVCLLCSHYNDSYFLL